MIELVFSGSLAGALPGPMALQASMLATLNVELAASLSLLAEINVELPSLKADLDVSLGIAASLSASLSIDPSLTIAASLAFAADAQLALAANLTGPALSLELGAQLSAQIGISANLSAQIGLKVSALAALELRIGAIRAALKLAIDFAAGLSGAAGVRLYFYSGPLKNLALELNGFLALDGLDVDAAALAARAGLNIDLPVYVPIFLTDSTSSLGSMSAVFAL